MYLDTQSAQNLSLAVSKTVNIRNELEIFLSDLKDAETGERGYIITGDEAYLEPYTAATAEIPRHLDKLRNAVADDPLLQYQVDAVVLIAQPKLAELDKIIRIRHDQGFEEAAKSVKVGHEKNAMDDLRRSVADIVYGIDTTIEAQDAQLATTRETRRLTMLISIPLLFLVIFLAFVFTSRSIRRQLNQLADGIARIRSGDLTRVLSVDSKDEIGVIARAFNEMADTLNAEHIQREVVSDELRKIDSVLRDRSKELEARTKTIDLLARMTQRLPGCSTEAELAGIVECFAPQILDDIPGILYVMSNSHTILRSKAAWKDPKAYLPDFVPADCWGLRRGQPHLISDTATDVVCAHVNKSEIKAYQCLPLIAQDDTLGVLYLEAAPTQYHLNKDLTPQVLAETIALALLNMRLRDNLRKQSIRDVLTGLFNRRYLEETLELYFARAKRTNSSISIVMLDIDHFKKFNDAYGHQIGDLVLAEVGKLLGNSARKGDIACRYGGEEFVLV